MARRKSDQFEDALKKLQIIVDRMEHGDLPLEEAVESFTEGIRLVQYCHQKLQDAENKVQMLLRDQQDKWLVSPFEPISDNNSNE